jgi:eukaryotic-like serine/threonine-protein kinase
LTPGTIIEGRFELEREAGAGGMGVVYRALDRLDATPLAVKILRASEAEQIERFEREATVLAELRHPGIVRYIANGATPTGERYLVMEWLEGEDLTQRLSRKPLTISESLTIVQRASAALVAAHQRGVLHRDIKPSNIFLVDRDVERVKLLDFGIARLASDASRITRSGMLLGTPAYMAPEQAQGSAAHDPRADVFALGCVLFECVIGRPAFEGVHPMAVLAKVILEEVPPLRRLRPEVPEALERLVIRMLAKDPAGRPGNAAEVAAQLGQLQSDFDSLHGAQLMTLDSVSLAGDTSSASAPSSFNALTLVEQRLVTMLLTSAPDPEDISGSRSQPRLDMKPYGGQLSILADGSMLVTIAGSGSVLDRAVRAAHCALALRAHYSGLVISVVTGRGVVSKRIVEDRLIDRGVAALRATSGGMIQIDAPTATMLEARFIIEPENEMLVLRGERSQHAAAPRLLGKAVPCVGRGREISMLEAIQRACFEEPQASVALVTGPAGAGKSRLRHEFLQKLGQQDEPVEVLTGRADSHGESAPFGILSDAVRASAGIQDSDAPETRRYKLTRRLGRHLEGNKLTRVASFLGEMTGTRFPDEADPALKAARENAQLMSDAMRAAWEDWLSAECDAQPVVLVLEDMHWGDAATARLMDATLRSLAEKPLLVLTLARPEIHARFPGLWAERTVQQLKLGALSRKASEQIVREALGRDTSAEVVGKIVARADGNPFFVEELIRAVRDGRGDAFPESVLGVIEARLDAEGQEAKRVLRAASVFGERFTGDGVSALLGGEGNRSEAEAWLAILKERELISKTGAADGGGDKAYMFRHALVQEAAYATLTEEDRALGHRLAGIWLEESGSSEVLTVAEHFRRGGDDRRAVPWYRRAAEQSLSADDLSAALAHASRGVACGAVGEELGALRRIEAEAHAWRGELGIAEERGLEAMALLPRGSAMWFRALANAIIAAGNLGAFERVETRVELVRDTDAVPDARAAQIFCASVCAIHALFGGKYAAAAALLEAMEHKVRELEAIEVGAMAAFEQTRATRATTAGDLGAGLAGFSAALAAFEQAGDQRNACSMRTNLGFILMELGDFRGAEDALRSAYASGRRMGLDDLAAVSLHNLGHVLAYTGDLVEARALERQAAEVFQEQGNPRLAGLAQTYMAKIEILAGAATAAESEARLAVEILAAVPPLRAGAFAVLSRALLAQGRAEEALAAAREGHALLAQLGTIEEGEALVRLAYAEALLACGEEAAFAAAIGEAQRHLLARAEKISDPVWRERFLTNVPDNTRTLELAAKARA